MERKTLIQRMAELEIRMLKIEQDLPPVNDKIKEIIDVVGNMDYSQNSCQKVEELEDGI